MGLTHVTVRLRSLGSQNGIYEADFLVDTGATDSLAPASELTRAGVRPVGRTAYELAKGAVEEYPFGLVEIMFMGEITAGRVIFGPDSAEPILGVTALESVGITVDPATRTLKRLPAIPLKWRREGLIMGLTVLEIEVGNPANPDITEKIEFLIDSGAIYSVVSTPILERLGIRPLTEQEFRLADGTKISRKKGVAVFKYGERIGGADVIFGEQEDSTLLGAFTLEALGLSLDPLRRELKPLPMILAEANRNKT